jgi:phage-related protein
MQGPGRRPGHDLEKGLTGVHMRANMKNSKRSILFYRTAEGKCPVEDFLDSLPGKAAQKITWVLGILENQGVLPAMYFKKLVNTDIWECRVQYSSNVYRLLCFFDRGSIIILTHGFIKKTQKTPGDEIKRAEEYRNDYLRRRHV